MVGVTSRILTSSLLLMSCRSGFLDFLWRVMIIGLSASSASLTASMKSWLSTSIFPTSSMTMMSQFWHASRIALTPISSSLLRSTPIFPTMTLLSISVLAKTAVSPVARSLTVNPVLCLPSPTGSSIMPPMESSSSFSISITLRRA